MEQRVEGINEALRRANGGVGGAEVEEEDEDEAEFEGFDERPATEEAVRVEEECKVACGGL